MDRITQPEILAIGLGSAALFVSLLAALWIGWATRRVDRILLRLALSDRLAVDRCPLVFKEDPALR